MNQKTPPSTNLSGVSCDVCRKRKVKCSRDLPDCAWCSKHKVICTYPSQSHRRRNDTSSTAGKININMDNSRNKYWVANNGSRQKATGERRVVPKSNNNLAQFVLYRIINSNPLDRDTDSMASSNDLASSLSPNSETPLYHFRLQTLILLVSQIIEKQPDLTHSIEPFFRSIKSGELGKNLKLKIFLDNNWYQILHHPNFESQMIENYFTGFNPFITYIGKFYFFKNLHRLPNNLLHVIKFIGYQFTLNQDKQLRNYLKNLCLIELKQNFFKVSLLNCISLFIFSYSELMQGFMKKSWAYYNQGCLMASAMGIHLDVPTLDELDQDRRHIVRTMVLCQDQHLVGALDGCVPYFEYMVYQVTTIDYRFQLPPIPHWDILEVIDAQANCILKYTYDRYWVPAIHQLSSYCLKNTRNHLTLEQLDVTITKFIKLFDYCFIQGLNKFLQLGQIHNFTEAHKTIEKNVTVFVLMYHHMILTLFSHYPTSNQFSPDSSPPLWLSRALYSAKIIFNTARNCPKSYLIMHHHYLTEIALFYLKFSSAIGEYYRKEFQLILQSIYEMFLSYNSKYSFSNFTTEAFLIISQSLGYQFNAKKQLAKVDISDPL